MGIGKFRSRRSLPCPNIMSDEVFSDSSTYMTASTGEARGEP